MIVETNSIYVDSKSPQIIYKYGVLTDYDSNTNYFSGSSTGITSGVTISKAIIFNISGFDGFKITKIDIIDNVIDYIYDEIDSNLNKYMLDVLIVDQNFIYTTGVTEASEYCVKFKITDRFYNSVENYIIMMTVDSIEDVAFPGGIWRDDQIWIDTSVWVDDL